MEVGGVGAAASGGGAAGTAGAAEGGSGSGGSPAGSAPAAAGGGVPAGTNPPPAGTGEPQPAPYTPNLKYKVLREEKEIPDWARPFVTSGDLEKNFKDVFERADGIESVKQHRDALVSENAQMREEWMPAVQTMQAAQSMLQQGDIHGFLQLAGIPEIEILKYAHKRIQLRETPGALEQHDELARIRLENQQYQSQLEESQRGQQTLASQNLEFQMDTHLARPENLSAVQAFDARVGRPGAFRAEVVRRGQAYAAQGHNISAEQAVMEVLQLIGWSGQNPATAANGGAGATGMGQAHGSAQPKPVLPNLRGTGGSPVKKAARSTAELRELARTMKN